MPSYFFSGNLFLFPSQSLTWRSIWDIETPLPGRSQQQCFKMPSSRHAIPQIWDIGTLPPCRCLSDLKHWNTPTLQVPSGRYAALHAKHVTTINTTNKCMMTMVVLMYWFNITTCISNISNMSYAVIASSEGWQFSNFKSGNAGTFSFIPRSSSESNNANWRGAGYQTDRGLISECVSMSMLASMLGPYPAIPDFVLGLAIWRFIISTSSIITSKSNQGELFNLLF